jgi:hypothetical protein
MGTTCLSQPQTGSTFGDGSPQVHIEQRALNRYCTRELKRHCSVTQQHDTTRESNIAAEYSTVPYRYVQLQYGYVTVYTSARLYVLYIYVQYIHIDG